MKKQHHHARHTIKIVSAALLAIALGIVTSARSQADAISYSLMFSESLDILKDPTNTKLISHLSAQTQHSLMMQRTNPYFELRNTSEEAMLTQISLTIGDLSKNFDWANIIETSPGVSVNVLTVDNAMGGISSDVLTLSFDGLAPGDYVRFRVGLAADNPSDGYLQDFRKVLFDLNGGSDNSSNSIVTVDFKSLQGTGTITDQMQNFGMNGLTTATNMTFPGGPCFDHIVPFSMGGSGQIEVDPGNQVPEPGSIVLMGLGLLGLVVLRLRKRGAIASS